MKFWDASAIIPLLADEPTRAGGVRRTSERLLRAHPLRVADSLQLAAALVGADHDPVTLDLVCLDTRLTTGARREGFQVQEIE